MRKIRRKILEGTNHSHAAIAAWHTACCQSDQKLKRHRLSSLSSNLNKFLKLSLSFPLLSSDLMPEEEIFDPLCLSDKKLGNLSAQ